MSVWQRLYWWGGALGAALSQFGQIFWVGMKWVVFGGSGPDPDETISALTGRHARAGSNLALVLEWFIDRLMYIWEGGRLGHCRDSADVFANKKNKQQ